MQISSISKYRYTDIKLISFLLIKIFLSKFISNLNRAIEQDMCIINDFAVFDNGSVDGTAIKLVYIIVSYDGKTEDILCL